MGSMIVMGFMTEHLNHIQMMKIVTTTIAGDLNVNSDARLKANIISLGSTLSKLLQIDGKSRYNEKGCFKR